MTNNKWQALKGYLEALNVGFTITPAYFERLNKHYIPNCEATISQEPLSPTEGQIMNAHMNTIVEHVLSNPKAAVIVNPYIENPIVKANPDDCKFLIEKIEGEIVFIESWKEHEETDNRTVRLLTDCKAKLIQLGGGK